MRQIRIEPDFSRWREEARRLLEDGVPPDDVLWTDSATEQEELFGGGETPSVRVRDSDPVAVPKSFLRLATAVACHRDPQRWAILYRLLWRITRGEERHLLIVSTDPDVRRSSALAKEVARDVHKMRAFVRFRKVGETLDGREQFVSWFEPNHRIVRRNAPFFRKRFTGMDWSILTPDECAHWDGQELHFTPGVDRNAAPDGDELEELWRGYYKSIFNPSRLKLKAMQAEMPVKYWKNLPEADLIHDLAREASRRRERMIEAAPRDPGPAPRNLYLQDLEQKNASPVLREAAPPSGISLAELGESASCCRACPLWERATQTVFGEGNPHADLMFIGEQPGDREDLEGRPFVGPAGKLLRGVLQDLGVSGDDCYFTNAVKHFKWKPAKGGSRGRGPRRLHDKANRDEMHACRPWLLGEISRVRPRIIVTLGNTAGQSLLGPDFRVLEGRGEVDEERRKEGKGRIFATVHPSFLLRIPDGSQREEEEYRFRGDLSLAIEAWRSGKA